MNSDGSVQWVIYIETIGAMLIGPFNGDIKVNHGFVLNFQLILSCPAHFNNYMRTVSS